MQILGSTGTYAFIQTAGLLVFIESVTEAFLLQIQSSRMRKEYTGGFDYKEIGRGISRIVIFFSVIIWLIVFATNLNIYNAISDQISAVLTKARSIGSFTFTYGGVILFILIMWAANFLQRYIGYFFGNIGDDVMLDNKGGQRSKLMIVKLVLIVAGFLLAVAASGLAIDKITVILGALSVGIGLGLQNIVNNFVSGIILIFDRTIHIGDTVEIGDKKGRVKQISMRSSTLLTAEGAEVIIPNGNILSKDFVNWSLNDNYIRVDLTFTVSAISKDQRQEILKIIKSSKNVADKEPEILTNTVTSQSTQLKIYFWCEDVTKREIARSEVYTEISKYLEEQGVNIL
jgi:small-conductance mechanosensitive channel